MSRLRSLCAFTLIATSLYGGERSTLLGSAIFRGAATINGKPISGTTANLGDNDLLRTGTKSGAILTIAQGDTIVAGENTSIVLARSPLGTVARIEDGVATVSTRSEQLRGFQTGGGTVAIRSFPGARSRYRIARLGNTTYVVPTKGEISIANPNGSAVGVTEGMMGVIGDSATVERYVRRAALEIPQQTDAPRPSNTAQGKKAGQLSAVIPAGYIVRGSSQTNGAAGAPVYLNDLLKTGGRGRMRFTLDDGSIVNVGPNSRFQVKEQDVQSQQTTVEMMYGKMRAQVSKRTNASGKFEIRTATAICGVIGTDLFVEATPTMTRVVVFDGIVKVSSLAAGVAAFTLVANQTGTVSLSGATAPAAASSGQLQAAVSSTQISGAGAATTAGTGGMAAGTNVAVVTAVLVPPAIAAAVSVPLLSQEAISPTQP